MNTSRLVDALPWESNSPPTGKRTIVVHDSIETDGRFLLHTLASQYMSLQTKKPTRDHHDNSKCGFVLWIACGASTERQIVQSLKRVGHEGTLPLSSHVTSQKKALKTIHVAFEMASMVEAQNNLSKEKIDSFLKDLYLRIRSLIENEHSDQGQVSECTFDNISGKNALVVIDDVSSLACMFGQLKTHTFIQKLRLLNGVGCLALRASLDIDQEMVMKTHGTNGDEWIGAGGSTKVEEKSDKAFSTFERNLSEIADGIIDVLPLPSGISREAHGRIIFTERFGGKGWNDARKLCRFSEPYVLNFCVGDGGVNVIRLKTGSLK